MAAQAAAKALAQKLKTLVEAVDADAAAQVYAGVFGDMSLGDAPPRGPAPPKSWAEGESVKTATTVYASVAKALEALASKAPLILGEASVTQEAAQSICKEIGQTADQLATATALLQTDTAGAGAPLRAVARVNGRRLLDAWRSLADALATEKDVPKHVGVAWEASKLCATLPQSNRAAYRREFLGWAKQLKDVVVEFEELLAQDYVEGEDSFDDPFGGLDDAYPPSDTPAAETSVVLLKLVGQLYKQALLAIDAYGTQADYAKVSQTYAAADALREATVALGEELYAPLDADALGAILQSLNGKVGRLSPLVHGAADLPPPPPEERWRVSYAAAVEAVKGVKNS